MATGWNDGEESNMERVQRNDRYYAAGAADERDRLRPLLERCLDLAVWAGDAEEDLAADLRRELGKDGGE